MREQARILAGGFVVAAGLLAGCGSEADSAASETQLEPTQNACPVDGCTVVIDSVEAADGELMLTWTANFVPDFSKNHIHVYWDTYEAAEVSSDATANGLEQGVWVPTDSYPTYTTNEVVSTSAREGSTTLCVTTSNGDHSVIDPTAVHCMDVSEFL